MPLSGCSEPRWAALAAFLWLIHLILEYWLGKTQRTKAGSVVEVVIMALVTVVLLVSKFTKEKE